MEDNKTEDMFDLGAWLGRKQAFTLMAGRCSAAGVVALKGTSGERLMLKEPTGAGL